MCVSWPRLYDGGDTFDDLHDDLLFVLVLPNVSVLFYLFSFLPALANNGDRYSCTGLAVALSPPLLVHVPSNFTSVAPIHQELPTLKSTLAHFVLPAVILTVPSICATC